MDVDAIQQGAGDAGTVAVDGQRRAAAGMGWIREIATGADMRYSLHTF